jgi:hypothetical protein
MRDVCFDAIDLMNRTLNYVEIAYPGFTKRFDVIPEASKLQSHDS